jgi:hypothetical protein
MMAQYSRRRYTGELLCWGQEGFLVYWARGLMIPGFEAVVLSITKRFADNIVDLETAYAENRRIRQFRILTLR